jgi:hypothetical protein
MLTRPGCDLSVADDHMGYNFENLSKTLKSYLHFPGALLAQSFFQILELSMTTDKDP